MGLLDAVKALLPLAHHVTDGQANLKTAIMRETASARTIEDAVAGTDYVYDLWVAPRAGKLKSFKIVPLAALVADNDNYSTVGPVVRDVGAATTTDVGTHLTTQITGTGNWVLGVEETVTVDDTATFIAGDKICLGSAKTGTGVQVPACLVSFEVEYN